MFGTNTLSAVKLQKYFELVHAQENLEDGLALLAATQYHISAGKSYTLSNEIVDCLLAYPVPSEPPQPALYDALNIFYLQELLPREPEIRCGILKRMVFCHEIFSDADLLNLLARDMTYTELYDMIHGEDPLPEDLLTEELFLRDRLLTITEQLKLSRASTKVLAKELAKGEYYISNITTLAYECFLRRCIHALHLYLTEDGLSLQEAVALAVRNTPLEIYPQEHVTTGVSAFLILLCVPLTLFFTGFYLGSYTDSWYLAETFAILTSLFLYFAAADHKPKLNNWALSCFILLRELRYSPAFSPEKE